MPDASTDLLRLRFAGARLLSGLRASVRRSLGGRVVAAISTSRAYALRGVRPGIRVAQARRHLRLRHGVRVRASTWYVVANGPAAGLVEVRRGVIVAVGTAARDVSRGPGRLHRLLAGLT